MNNIDMAEYGLENQYEVQTEPFEIGRIVSQKKGLYSLVSKNGEQLAEISGKFRYNARHASDFPAVGDFVSADCKSAESRAVIHSILPRKSVFIRKAAGKGNAEQVVAANIDTIFICMSLNNDFNVRRLERYLSAAWDSGATPVVVLTKSDLCPDAERYKSLAESVAFGADIVVTSSEDKDGYKNLMPYIKRGKTISLIGSSGVGKSTLVNRLLHEERLETNGLRNDDKGRHTTTERELFLLEGGGMVIDTPGMRELGMWNVGEGFDKSFADIEKLAAECRFSDCSHTNEPHCAVREAIEAGILSAERLQSYRKLKAENKYSENSEEYLAEKKQKFKNIAKINKIACKG